MRKILFATFVLLLSTSSLFAQDWRNRRYERYRDSTFDLTPFGGYRYGGTLFADQSSLFSNDVGVKSSGNYGLGLDIPISSTGFKIQLLIDRQDTNFTRGGGLFSRTGNLGDFHVTYYQGGVLIPFAESRTATPFVSLTAGVANLNPDIAGVSASNRFSGSAAIGVKIPINRNVAFRIEERGYFTSMSDEDTNCRRCGFNEDHDLYQGETNIGVSLRF